MSQVTFKPKQKYMFHIEEDPKWIRDPESRTLKSGLGNYKSRRIGIGIGIPLGYTYFRAQNSSVVAHIGCSTYGEELLDLR
jgi:hypothetical protein